MYEFLQLIDLLFYICTGKVCISQFVNGPRCYSSSLDKPNVMVSVNKFKNLYQAEGHL